MAHIKRNKEIREEGGYNSIPFSFPRLNKYLPGIIRGVQYLITANSGVGKTQLAKYMFVYGPYKFIKEHPDSGISLKILYFALEESKEEFMFSMISNRLKVEYNISVDVNTLNSYGEHNLSDEIVEKIEECEEYFRNLDSILEVIDGIDNPTGIYKYVREYSQVHGTHYYYDFKKDSKKEHPFPEYNKPNSSSIAYSHYVPDNPKEYVIVVCDHMSLLMPEKGTPSLHEAMTKMSADYARKQITKHFKYIFVGVQQQSSDKEKLQFTSGGRSIEQKLEPSLDGLGDNKLTQRDALVVIGLFAPVRYKMDHHDGYNVKKLGDNYRCLTVIKNRIGRPYLRLGLYFNGETNEFKELPKIMNEEDYEKYT